MLAFSDRVSYSCRNVSNIDSSKRLQTILNYMLPLICDLPQIVYIYIYSSVAETVSYSSVDYPKFRAIVNENSADADDQLLKDI